MNNLVLRFDMRYPTHCPTPIADFYQAAVDMSAWAEQHGFNAIGLSEHHNTQDGYLPSPITLASAIAARTHNTPISIAALLLPLHDPLRLAEDLAVLDILSRGRVMVTAGLGYRPEEYAALGVDWTARGRIMDEKLAVLLQAWQGEPFEYRGATVQVLPRPHSRPHPMLCVGGNSRAAARRAARFRLPFMPAVDDGELADYYQQQCQAREFDRGLVMLPQQPATTFIAEDVEQAWEALGQYMLYDALSYGQWQHATRRAYAESFATNLQELRAEGKYRILTPTQAVAVCRKTGSMHLAPLVGGTPPELGWRSLRLFADQVLPRL
jgi:alkanesulfonate monooxygenase SsuD/methylene tetrahydromethanopterin reductase-like flavin-dependent oxidoreductase (luciferase family)